MSIQEIEEERDDLDLDIELNHVNDPSIFQINPSKNNLKSTKKFEKRSKTVLRNQSSVSYYPTESPDLTTLVASREDANNFEQFIDRKR